MVTPEPKSRRIVMAGAGTAAGLALLFAYPTSLNRSGTPGRTPGPAGASASGGTGPTGGAGPTIGAGPTSGAGPTAGTSGGAFTGDAVNTRWGPVQVEITVEGGKVVSVRTVQVPANNSVDLEINDYAVPILNQEAVQAGSADIDAVSGATVTSDGYIGSLQSALDKAHL